MGSEVIEAVRQVCARHERVLVILDSNHTADHVAAELSLYGDFVSVGSYLIVMDTFIKDLPTGGIRRPAMEPRRTVPGPLSRTFSEPTIDMSRRLRSTTGFSRQRRPAAI